jgi:hypothetical protein
MLQSNAYNIETTASEPLLSKWNNFDPSESLIDPFDILSVDHLSSGVIGQHFG